jgi:signal transduction histidine kinase
MEAPLQQKRPLRLPPGSLAILGALVLLGVAMAAVRIPFRDQLRNQLAARDARVLAALIQQQLNDPENPAAGDDPLAAIIAASIAPDLPGVEAVQAYSPEGRLFATFLGPTNALTPPTLLLPSSDRPVVRFHDSPSPRLEVWLPLRPDQASENVGYTFIALDGSDLAAEYARLDSNLLRQVAIAFVLIGTTLAVILALNFRHLAQANRLLADRSHRLEQANRELSLAARTSAVGAVASHLVHGLRNPLAALQYAVANGGDTRDAADSARRMRTMIDDVVRMLRDEQGLAGFEIPASEILDEARRRCLSHSGITPGLRWELSAEDGPPLDNRSANLSLLVLENLASNAIHAMNGAGRISIRAHRSADSWQFQLEDDGPGISAETRDRLFAPVLSSRPDGSGIGLAISRQLARHLGGDLQLAHSRPGSTRFDLTVPLPTTAANNRSLSSTSHP